MNTFAVSCCIGTIDELNRKINAYRELTGVTPRIRLEGIFCTANHNIIEIKCTDYNVASIDRDYIQLYGVANVCIQFADIDVTAYLS